MGPVRWKYRFLHALEPDAAAFWVAYVLLLPVYLAPLFVTPILPGLDLPFHLSMADMLDKNGRAGSPYGPFYEGAPGIAPYAAYYMALWLVGKAVALTTAHKVVVALYVASLPVGAGWLLGACGRSRLPALFAFPLAYNLTLHYGFISFALSLPVLAFLLAVLTRFLLSSAFDWRLWAATAAFLVLLFLCHLQNFLYGVCASLAFVALSGVRWRRRLQGLAAFLPAMGALAWWLLSAHFAHDPLQQRRTLKFAWIALKWARLNDLGNGTIPLLADLRRRLLELSAHVLRGFDDLVDVRACGTLMALLFAYMLLGLWGRREPAPLGSPPRMRLAGWVAFAGALFAYLALPHHLQAFELMTFYPRFSALLVLTFLLLLPAGLRNFSGGLRVLLPVPIVVFGLLYGRELVKHYRQYGQEVSDFVAVLDRTPPGGKALGLVYDRESRVMRIESALLGLPNFYPAAKTAPGSMTPLAYCGMRHIPCRRKEPQDALPDPGPWEPHRMRPEKAVPFFEYFFVRSLPPGTDIFGPENPKVELLAKAGTWAVYRRKPGIPGVPAPAAAAAKAPRK